MDAENHRSTWQWTPPYIRQPPGAAEPESLEQALAKSRKPPQPHTPFSLRLPDDEYLLLQEPIGYGNFFEYGLDGGLATSPIGMVLHRKKWLRDICASIKHYASFSRPASYEDTTKSSKISSFEQLLKSMLATAKKDGNNKSIAHAQCLVVCYANAKSVRRIMDADTLHRVLEDEFTNDYTLDNLLNDTAFYNQRAPIPPISANQICELNTWDCSDTILGALKLERKKVDAVIDAAWRCFQNSSKIEGISPETIELKRKIWFSCFGPDLMFPLELGSDFVRRRNVLIQGPTGSGKELVAKAIQAGTIAADFVNIPSNVTISGPELEPGVIRGELFGVRAGFVSGVEGEHTGKIAMADGGTLYMDEVADLPQDAQAALLRVIQEETVMPIGGSSEPIPARVRYITATNADFTLLIKEKMFRGDLLARLNNITIRLLPLHERLEDILPIADAYFQNALKTVSKQTDSYRMVRSRYEKWRTEMSERFKNVD